MARRLFTSEQVIFTIKSTSLEFETSLADIIVSEEEDSFYAGLTLNLEYCPYNLTTYASDVMEDTYKSTSPYLFALAACAIFAFTGLVFIGYDKLVRQRQEKVMHTGKYCRVVVCRSVNSSYIFFCH